MAKVRRSTGRQRASRNTSRRPPPWASTASASSGRTRSSAVRNTTSARPTQAHTNADMSATVTSRGPRNDRPTEPLTGPRAGSGS